MDNQIQYINMPIKHSHVFESIPMGLLLPHEEHVKILRSGKTLTEIADQGGLFAIEAMAIIEEVSVTTASMWINNSNIGSQKEMALRDLVMSYKSKLFVDLFQKTSEKPWVQVIPKYPNHNGLVEVQCDDGSIRKARWGWHGDSKTWISEKGGAWSMAHPGVIAWQPIV